VPAVLEGCTTDPARYAPPTAAEEESLAASAAAGAFQFERPGAGAFTTTGGVISGILGKPHDALRAAAVEPRGRGAEEAVQEHIYNSLRKNVE
jgi:hypothetical protein